LFSERRNASGFRVPEPEVSALVDFLTPYLSGGEVKERYARRLAAALEPGALRARALARRLFGRTEADALCAELVEGRRAALEAGFRRRRRGLLARRFLRAPLRSLACLAAFAYSSRIRPLWRPSGRLVVFLGTDGVGKTTVMEALAREVTPAFRSAESGTFHLRPGLLPQLDRVVHLGRRTQGEADWRRPHRAAPSGRLLSNLRVAWYALDYVLGYVLKILPRRRRNSLILFDRYFHDYLVDPLRCRVRPRTLLVRALLPLVPRPDAVIVVTADLPTVLARKQELPPGESERQLAAYEELAAQGGRFHLVRNEGSVEEAVDAVVRALFAGRGA
jgi:thymidylate kinase